MTAIPVLVTPPSAPVVSLEDAKMHLRIDHADQDAMIEGLVLAATAHLDGWRGVLGRAIMPQVWQETHVGPGPYLLAMPDVSEVTASARGAIRVETTALGPVVALAEPVEGVTLSYTCGLPAAQLRLAEVAVKLYIAHLYDGSDLSPAFGAMVEALRWRQA
ncbi:head-tail connector protein [Rhodovulum sulfidophilum]|uniref:head-tail connector protein n=1 Tax=Rhodovulum sulfidophilum TaxID=35806 RepID=UPI000951E7C4|nr:head-tail connector protein [Rhodovulum sulfidophilum]OLS51863.1 hypothetical protein BV392_07490 [Rhodovulum sulfidophilum]